MGIHIDLFSTLPFFALIAASMLLASCNRFFAPLDATPTGRTHQLETLDGLRGFLALAVFVHHATVTYGYVKTGVWQVPPSRFYTLLGQVGVSLFFAMTGYLFWNKLLANKGRMDWVSLYIGRFFRIVPLYLFAIFIMLTVTFHRTHGTLTQPGTDVLLQVLNWLTFGLFDRGRQVLINGYDARLVLAGVTWTLYYEWLFYFSLRATAVIAASRWHLALLAAALLIIFHAPAVLVAPVRYFIALFVCGMLTASIRNTLPSLALRGPVFSALAVLILYLVFTNFDSAYQTKAVLLLGAFFLLVANGATIFGLLTLRASKRLGNISYSIYLLHGVVLTVIFSQQVLGEFGTRGPVQFWATAMLCCILVTIVAALAFSFVERPGIALGKRLSTRYASRAASPGSPLGFDMQE